VSRPAVFPSIYGGPYTVYQTHAELSTVLSLYINLDDRGVIQADEVETCRGCVQRITVS